MNLSRVLQVHDSGLSNIIKNSLYFKKSKKWLNENVSRKYRKEHRGQLTWSSCSNYDNKNIDKTNDEILKFIRVIKREVLFQCYLTLLLFLWKLCRKLQSSVVPRLFGNNLLCFLPFVSNENSKTFISERQDSILETEKNFSI